MTPTPHLMHTPHIHTVSTYPYTHHSPHTCMQTDHNDLDTPDTHNHALTNTYPHTHIQYSYTYACSPTIMTPTPLTHTHNYNHTPHIYTHNTKYSYTHHTHALRPTIMIDRSISFPPLILCGPHICVRDLGRLTITSPVFGWSCEDDNKLLSQTPGLSLVEEAIRIRCCKIEHNDGAANLSPSKSEWKRLICLTEFTPWLMMKNNVLVWNVYTLSVTVIVTHTA